jgi:hypothetical protein
LDRRLGGLRSRSGNGGEEKNSQPLAGIEPPIIQPVAQSSFSLNIGAETSEDTDLRVEFRSWDLANRKQECSLLYSDGDIW